MKKVIVASTNPVKIRAAKLGLESVFPDEEFSFEGVKASSGVADQPKSNKETLQGAQNRVADAQRLSPGADFYVGLEGGVEDVDGEMHEFAWIVVHSQGGRSGKGRTVTFFPPPIFRKMVLEGMEIGDITDAVFGTSNSKQETGAIGLLTRGVIDRAEMYRHAVVSALMPFVHPQLY